MHGSLRHGMLTRRVKSAHRSHISKIFELDCVIEACTCLTLLQNCHLHPLRPLLRELVGQPFGLQVCVSLKHLQRLVA
jgi:hypothetical protein